MRIKLSLFFAIALLCSGQNVLADDDILLNYGWHITSTLHMNDGGVPPPEEEAEPEIDPEEPVDPCEDYYYYEDSRYTLQQYFEYCTGAGDLT